MTFTSWYEVMVWITSLSSYLKNIFTLFYPHIFSYSCVCYTSINNNLILNTLVLLKLVHIGQSTFITNWKLHLPNNNSAASDALFSGWCFIYFTFLHSFLLVVFLILMLVQENRQPHETVQYVLQIVCKWKLLVITTASISPNRLSNYFNYHLFTIKDVSILVHVQSSATYLQQ